MTPPTTRPSRSRLSRLAPLLLLLGLTPAMAVPYYYVDWTTANVGNGTASGFITLPDSSHVNVTFAATYATGQPGNLAGAQVSGGVNYWSPSSPYISTQVDNAPGSTDILQLSGGLNQIYTVTLSEAIKDPIMAIVSLGRYGTPTTYDFSVPFTIVSQGVGYFGGGPQQLHTAAGDLLIGNEGHGTIQFQGTFSTFSWTVPTPEYWHGFTFGIRTTEAIEPTHVPDAGTSLLLLGLGLAALGGGIGLSRRRVRAS